MKTILCLIASVAFVSLVVAQAPAAAKTPGPKLINSAVYDWNDLKPQQRPNGERRAVFDNPTETLANFECHITTLKVGENSGPAHTHTVEEATFVKEGTVEVLINDTKRTIGPGSVFYFAAKDAVAIRNVGATPATYVVFSIRATPAAK